MPDAFLRFTDDEALEWDRPRRVNHIRRANGPRRQHAPAEESFGCLGIVLLALVACIIFVGFESSSRYQTSGPSQQTQIQEPAKQSVKQVIAQEKMPRDILEPHPAQRTEEVQKPEVPTGAEINGAPMSPERPIQSTDPQIINVLTGVINGQTYAVEFRSYNPQDPKATVLWTALPPELEFSGSHSDFPVFDRPNGNFIWTMPAETKFVNTRAAYVSSATCDWKWFTTIDGQHSGYINIQR